MKPIYYKTTLVILSAGLLAACTSHGPKLPPKVKVGKPYEVFGQTYYPKYEPYYDETGMASWYGPGFHGKKTANGERFNKHDMTGAHRTLPLPSLVRVTNLANGKSAVVRINDRGPFSKGRIIDLSKAAAQKIGMIGAGVAKVRVQYLARETEEFWATNNIDPPEDMSAVRDDSPGVSEFTASTLPPELETRVSSAVAPVTPVDTEELPMAQATPPASTMEFNAPVTNDGSGFIVEEDSFEDEAPEAPKPVQLTLKPQPQTLSLPATTPGGWFVQAGSFSVKHNAELLGNKLKRFGKVDVSRIMVQGKEWYRVLVGPASSNHAAEKMLEDIFRAGIKDAKIIRF